MYSQYFVPVVDSPPPPKCTLKGEKQFCLNHQYPANILAQIKGLGFPTEPLKTGDDIIPISTLSTGYENRSWLLPSSFLPCLVPEESELLQKPLSVSVIKMAKC